VWGRERLTRGAAFLGLLGLASICVSVHVFAHGSTSVTCADALPFGLEPFGAPTSEVLLCEVQDVVVAELLPDTGDGLLDYGL
jgi:hypothetical protein